MNMSCRPGPPVDKCQERKPWQGPVAQCFSVFWCQTYLASVVLPTFTLIPDIYSIEILVWCCNHPRSSVFIIFKLMLHSNNETLLLICCKCSFQDASSDTLWLEVACHFSTYFQHSLSFLQWPHYWQKRRRGTG